MQQNKEKKRWNIYWSSLRGRRSLLGRFLELFRKYVIAPAVAHYFDKYFPKKGTFVEAGSGSAQTSAKIRKYCRKIIAVDISEEALKQASKVNVVDETRLADIRQMPFKKESIDGIWNLGVMEHFEEKETIKIINHFHDLLKKDGRVILLWPADYSLFRILVVPFETIARIFKKNYSVFPDEICRIHSKKHLISMLKRTKFKKYRIHFNIRDAYTHYVIVLYKQAK